MARTSPANPLPANPLLAVAGRRGRVAVAQALSRARQATNLRALAAAAGVHPVLAGRAVRELEALGAVEAVRPGRDRLVRWRQGAPAAGFLASLEVPDLRGATAAVFAAAYPAPPGTRLLRWRADGDADGDPFTPTRIAVVHRGDGEAALDAVGAALDAVREAGLPAPHVTPVASHELQGDDAVARAMRGGAPLAQEPNRAARPK